jgi:poly-beta-hydroxybutyrate-responsive repressor
MASDAPTPTLPKDFLRPALLLLLREEPAHGYDLLERARSLGFDGSDPGGLYRTLRKLEKEGMVRSSWESSDAGPQRRIYEITRAGKEELHDRAKGLAAGQELVASFLGRYEEFVALRSGRSDLAPKSRSKRVAAR